MLLFINYISLFIYLTKIKMLSWNILSKRKQKVSLLINILWPLIIVISIVIWMLFFKDWEFHLFLMISAILWLYMAMNIWANDVANNMWPAVWSKALTLAWAIIIAAIFEASWAIIAGWDVVDTIKGWIINANLFNWNEAKLLNIMMATLLGSALWINIATYVKAPVSATHSIIGWLMWAWITATLSFKVVVWSKIWAIVASWIISPLMWWIIAVILVISINKTILNKKQRWEAAKKWVPFFVSLMWTVFWVYLLLKWLKPLIKSNEALKWIITNNFALIIWIWIWILTYIFLSIHYRRKSAFFKNSKKFINKLFNVPLIFAIALLSFAHWSNDVANAIWPLAAINDMIWNQVISTKNIGVPFWIMFIWWIWIASWLAIFWWRLIKTVGWEITKLNQIRAFSVALSAAITVLLASHLGLPVSSTHIAIGWVFWVWILRERLKRLEGSEKIYIQKWIIKRIVLAWLITLPVSWIISWIVFLSLNKFLPLI